MANPLTVQGDSRPAGISRSFMETLFCILGINLQILDFLFLFAQGIRDSRIFSNVANPGLRLNPVKVNLFFLNHCVRRSRLKQRIKKKSPPRLSLLSLLDLLCSPEVPIKKRRYYWIQRRGGVQKRDSQHLPNIHPAQNQMTKGNMLLEILWHFEASHWEWSTFPSLTLAQRSWKHKPSARLCFASYCKMLDECEEGECEKIDKLVQIGSTLKLCVMYRMWLCTVC